MKRLLAISVLVAGMVFPASLLAQRGFAARPAPSRSFRMGSSFGGFRGAPAPFRSRMGSPAPFHRGGRSFGYSFGSRRPRYFFNPYSFGFPYGYGYSYIPSFSELPLFGYGDDYYAQPNDDDSASYQAPEQDNALAGQVRRLSNEVEAMRGDQTARSNWSPTTGSKVEQKPVATVLVYRDGHQSDVLNYAIQGQTLWVFSDQSTKRIPLADLNLDATRKVNEDRGVNFILPDTP